MYPTYVMIRDLVLFLKMLSRPVTCSTLAFFFISRIKNNENNEATADFYANGRQAGRKSDAINQRRVEIIAPGQNLDE